MIGEDRSSLGFPQTLSIPIQIMNPKDAAGLVAGLLLAAVPALVPIVADFVEKKRVERARIRKIEEDLDVLRDVVTAEKARQSDARQLQEAKNFIEKAKYYQFIVDRHEKDLMAKADRERAIDALIRGEAKAS